MSPTPLTLEPAKPSTTVPRRLPSLASPSEAQCLTVVFSPDSSAVGQRVKIPEVGGLLVIGREVHGEALCIRDPGLSRTHLRIVWDQREHAAQAIDARSLNGSFVNGERIHDCTLAAGDVLRVGDSLLVYERGNAHSEFAQQLDCAAASRLSILLSGETGSGKELAAQRLHANSGRAGRLVTVNCAAFPRELIAAELFGHRRGAFSGADRARPGLFVAADGGTLFLDEIADLPLELQPALLRCLEAGEVRPVGADGNIVVDVRVIAASHMDLASAVADGKFREDLYARIAQLQLEVPPLRKRRSDIIALAREFAAARGVTLGLTPDAAEALLLWSYPRNVRELKALLEAFVVLHQGKPLLSLAYLHKRAPVLLRRGSFCAASAAPASVAPPAPADTRRDELVRLMRHHQGNISKVATELGCRRARVYRWLKLFGLSADEYR